MKFITENWLYFVALGIMAYMMIKGGGCCGVGHSNQNKEDSSEGKTSGGGCCGGGSHHK